MASTAGDLYVPCWWPLPPRSATPHAGEREHHSPLSIMPSQSGVTLHAGISQSCPRMLAIAPPVRVRSGAYLVSVASVRALPPRAGCSKALSRSVSVTQVVRVATCCIARDCRMAVKRARTQAIVTSRVT